MRHKRVPELSGRARFSPHPGDQQCCALGERARAGLDVGPKRAPPRDPVLPRLDVNSL